MLRCVCIYVHATCEQCSVRQTSLTLAVVLLRTKDTMMQGLSRP